MTWADGTKYVGGRQEQGTETFADGSKYVGQFGDNKHGSGTYTFADGAKYVGEMFEGEFHGQGTKTFANGKAQKGAEHDKFRAGSAVARGCAGRREEGLGFGPGGGCDRPRRQTGVYQMPSTP